MAEREGAARAWEASLRGEQTAAQQALLDAKDRVKDTENRDIALKAREKVYCYMTLCVWLMGHVGVVVLNGVLS